MKLVEDYCFSEANCPHCGVPLMTYCTWEKSESDLNDSIADCPVCETRLRCKVEIKYSLIKG